MFWEKYISNENLINIGIAIGIFLIFWLLRKIFTKYAFNLLLKLISKTKSELLQHILKSFEKPMQWLFTIIGIYLAIIYFPYINQVNPLFLALIRVSLIILLAWGLYNVASASSYFIRKMKQKKNFDQDNMLTPLISKGLRIVIIAVSVTIILQEFGYDISGFVAGLGLGGLAISLAAKDYIANMIGGVIIITERPFKMGDWILTPNVEGFIEDISFRSTKVRTFSDALVTIPNDTLSNDPITNWTKMNKREITFTLQFVYDTTREQVESFVSQINYLLKNHSEIDQEWVVVHMNGYEEDGMEVYFYFFTKTTAWTEYVAIKQEIYLDILDLLNELDIKLAVPSRRLFMDMETEEPNVGRQIAAERDRDN